MAEGLTPGASPGFAGEEGEEGFEVEEPEEDLLAAGFGTEGEEEPVFEPGALAEDEE